MRYSILIISGSDYDLTKFDFSFRDIIIYDTQSEGFEKYIESIQPGYKDHNLSFLHNIKEQIHNKYEKKYAIVKNILNKNSDIHELSNVLKLLLIIFPSDLQIECSIDFFELDGILQCSATINSDSVYNPGESLISLDHYVNEINEFIKLSFDRLNNDNYLGFAIENYITSFTASHIHYQYLTLCIALECLIQGNQELTYRLRRTIAVLCGKDVFNCKIIFNNLNKLYSLRSDIIHGEKYHLDKVSEYLKPLQAIVSRAIIELLVHNVPTNKELHEIITELGYGDRAKISQNWKPYELNINTIVASNWKEI